MNRVWTSAAGSWLFPEAAGIALWLSVSSPGGECSYGFLVGTRFGMRFNHGPGYKLILLCQTRTPPFAPRNNCAIRVDTEKDDARRGNRSRCYGKRKRGTKGKRDGTGTGLDS